MKIFYFLLLSYLSNISSCKSQELNSFNIWILNKDSIKLEVHNFDMMTKISENQYLVNKDSTFEILGEKIYFNPDSSALLPNLTDFLNKNTPIINDNMEYYCVVGFIVGKEGEIKASGLIKGNRRRDYLRLLFELMKKMPTWEPAKHNSQKVSSFVKILIKFKVD